MSLSIVVYHRLVVPRTTITRFACVRFFLDSEDDDDFVASNRSPCFSRSTSANRIQCRIHQITIWEQHLLNRVSYECETYVTLRCLLFWSLIFLLSLKLPIYYDTNIDGTHRSTSRIDDEQQKLSNTTNGSSWLYSTVSQTRQSVQQAWNDNKVRRNILRRNVFPMFVSSRSYVYALPVVSRQAKLMPKVIRLYTEAGSVLERSTLGTLDYIRDDETFFPKVGVVTIAGLGGLLLGHRGGALRKTFYSSVAAAVALSACYPKQSSNLLDQVVVRIRNESRALLDSKSLFILVCLGISVWLLFSRDGSKSFISGTCHYREETRRE